MFSVVTTVILMLKVTFYLLEIFLVKRIREPDEIS